MRVGIGEELSESVGDTVGAEFAEQAECGVGSCDRPFVFALEEAGTSQTYMVEGPRPYTSHGAVSYSLLDHRGGGVGVFGTGFHAVPNTYLDGPPPTLDITGLLAPLQVSLIGGTALIDAAVLRKVGGLADLSSWDSGYADHLQLSADLTDSGAHLYHCPDPRLGATHMKFGAIGGYHLDRADLDTTVAALGRPFADLVWLSAMPREDTGHRLADTRFFPEQVGSFFAFFASRSIAGGLCWAVRSWREFVTEGNTPTLAVSGVPVHAERVRAWREGLQAAAAFLVSASRPPLDRATVRHLLGEVTDACGQPPISGW